MDAITALHSRTSVNLLQEPGPCDAQLNDIIKAGLRACDHHSLRPWRFIQIKGAARAAFGELMAAALEEVRGKPLDQELGKKIRQKPFRAPTIIVVSARIQEHPKVPSIEQEYSAAAAAQAMMVAAHALDIGAIWRSGSLMFSATMRRGLGLGDNDRIVGFIYLGTPKTVKPVPRVNVTDFLEDWSGVSD